MAASNSRIFITDGKSTSLGEKKFGLTVKDRQTPDPNTIQFTFSPATGTVQNNRFLLGSRVVTADAGVTPALANAATLTITPDLSLTSTRFYQFSAYLTIIIQTAAATYLSGHYLLTSAARGTTMIGSGGGYRLDTICSESGIDAYMDENFITLAITGNQFVITLTAEQNIDFSVDMMADVTINSGEFSV